MNKDQHHSYQNKQGEVAMSRSGDCKLEGALREGPLSNGWTKDIIKSVGDTI